MKQEKITYQAGDTECHGYVAYNPEIATPKPAVIVAHAWKGLDEFAKGKADALAEMGYFAFAADVYGEGANAENNEEALEMMTPLFLDRALLRERITAAYQTAAKHPEANSEKIGAIGYCFGGITVIELLRSGAAIRGAVSFHGTLARALGEKQAKLTPVAPDIKGAMLALHGHEDPMVSKEDVAHFEKEMTEARVDWQLHVFGHAKHAFTNPSANDPDLGLIYHPKASKRAWQSMCAFFDEVFA